MQATRFDELVELTSIPNWDHEGGAVIEGRDWEEARKLAAVIGAEVPRAPEPFFSAAGDGTIHIKWATGATSIEAEIDCDTFHWVVRGPQGRVRSHSLQAGDLIQAVRSLFS